MLTLPWLDSTNLTFPATKLALTEPNGLLAVGGDLSPQRLIEAYRHGIFPWYEHPQPIMWWTPNPRAVLFPSNIVISRSLKKRLRKAEYTVTCDQDFATVMNYCARIPRHGQDGTWIGADMLLAYRRLHEMGVAHSLEVWHEETLVGGLYGLAIGSVFYGESMFSLRSDASKVALVYLAQQLQEWGFAVIDCQVTNPHLLSMGAEEINRPQFDRILQQNVDRNNTAKWSDDWPEQLLRRMIG